MPTSTPTPQPSDLLGLLAEPDRLKVVVALTLGARTTGEVAEATGLTQRAATKALGRLTAGGLVESDPEREVDAALHSFHEDYALLRRYLVDEGFLQREAGVYWRTGGTFVV